MPRPLDLLFIRNPASLSPHLDFVHSETQNLGQKPFLSSLKLISSCPRNSPTLKNSRQQQGRVTMFQPTTPLLTGLGCLLRDLIASAPKWTKSSSRSVKKLSRRGCVGSGLRAGRRACARRVFEECTTPGKARRPARRPDPTNVTGL
jgi:hypothetical protein